LIAQTQIGLPHYMLTRLRGNHGHVYSPQLKRNFYEGLRAYNAATSHRIVRLFFDLRLCQVSALSKAGAQATTKFGQI